MTLSETQIDKFCQSPLGLHLPSNHPSEATTPILGTLTVAFLASLSAFVVHRRDAECAENNRGKTADWKELLVGSDRRISFLVLFMTPAARRFKASLFLGLVGVWAVE